MMRPKRKEIILPLTCSIIIICFLALMQFLNQGSVGGLWYWFGERTYSRQTPAIAQLITANGVFVRAYATFSHPNVFGGFLVILLPFFFLPEKFVKPWEYVLNWMACYTLLLGIFLSFSRAAWIVTFLLLTAIFLKKRLLFQKKTLLIISSCALLFICEEVFLGRFLQLWATDGQSINERLELLKAAKQFFGQSPLFGVGWGRFVPSLAKLWPRPTVLQPVHSIFALLAAETGIVGLGLFLLIYMVAIKKTWVKNDWGCFLSLAAVGILGSVDHYLLTLLQTQLLLTLLLAIAFV